MTPVLPGPQRDIPLRTVVYGHSPAFPYLRAPPPPPPRFPTRFTLAPHPTPRAPLPLQRGATRCAHRTATLRTLHTCRHGTDVAFTHTRILPIAGWLGGGSIPPTYGHGCSVHITVHIPNISRRHTVPDGPFPWTPSTCGTHIT